MSDNNKEFKIRNEKFKILVQNSRLLILIINFAFLIINLPLAYAWKLPIEVSTVTNDGKNVYNKLVVGIESGATDGFDNLWDTPAILSHPDPDAPLLLRAYITTPTLTLPNQGGVEEETKRLWKDIRGTSTKDNKTWDITIDSVPKGKAVLINWEIPQGVLKPGEKLVFRDGGEIDSNGEPVRADISQVSGYAFVSTGEEPRSLSLVLSKEVTDSKRSGSGSGFGCGTIK